MVRRIYVQKKPGFDVEAKGILEDLKENLQIKGLEQVVILNRYDVSGVDEESYNKAKTTEDGGDYGDGPSIPVFKKYELYLKNI